MKFWKTSPTIPISYPFPLLTNSLVYRSLLNYSPKEHTELAERSRRARDQIKSGRRVFIDKVLDYLLETGDQRLNTLLSPQTILVPIPRSTPLVEGALWPSKVIAEALVEKGLGKEVLPCLSRSYSVKKSAFQQRSQHRTSVEEHRDSLRLTSSLLELASITLVDDVITQGRTLYGAAVKMNEGFPKVAIKGFAFIRTMSFDPLEKFFHPQMGEIFFNPATGKTRRN